MVRMIFVRHGEAEGNVQRVFHGHHNSGLTENGKVQALLTAEFLEKEYKIDKIYSSDLSRAFETASYIAEKQRICEITKDENLREINGGEWENKPWSILPEMFPQEYSLWENDIGNSHLPGGESAIQMQKRATEAMCRIAEENEGKTVCIVTHGTVLKALLCIWKNLPIEQMQSLPWFDNASVSVVDYTGNGYNIILEGENKQLGEYSTLAKQTWWKK